MTRPPVQLSRGLYWLAAPFAATGCHGYASVFSAAGPAARSIGALGLSVMGILAAIGSVVLLLLLVGSVRRSGSLDVHQPVSVGGGQRWIFIGGLTVPGLVLCGVLIATLRTVDRFPLHDSGHYRADIHLVSRQYWWEIDYEGDGKSTRVTTANEMHIPLDWPVEIELESRDVIHSFWVPALHGKVDLVPGHENRIQIRADIAGRYQGECAEFCGPQHAHMNFIVVAEPLADYERWLAHQAAPARRSDDATTVAGEHLFESHACASCHTVRGTGSAAAVGPDLTHFASRTRLAANSYPNTRAYLEAWITHAQSLKPGSRMPDLTEFSGSELQSLTRYLESLD